MNRLVVLLLAFGPVACGAGGKKSRTSCDTDAQCSGGVCFASECYDACTEQHDCSPNELCVFKTDATGRNAAICAVAAEHAGCRTVDDCRDLATGPCEITRCDEAGGLCTFDDADDGSRCEPQPDGAGGSGTCSSGQCVCDTECPGSVEPSPDAETSEPDVVQAPSPSFGAWRVLPADGSPSPRIYVGGAWTASRFCLWGGYDGNSLGDGACYDPKTDAWKALPAEGAPEARCLLPVAWAGDRLCAWAGFGGGASGACWLEASDAWEAMAEEGAPSTPRQNHGAAWTGSELCYYGGRTAAGAVDLPDGGCYDPLKKTWRPLPAENAPSVGTNPSVLWVGDRLCVWGGWNASGFVRGGACQTPGATAWVAMSPAPEAVAPFVDGHAVGDRLCVWGGNEADGSGARSGGACYVPATDTWQVLPTVDEPTARANGYPSVWTGDWWCLFGGSAADGKPAAGGGCYSPALLRWFPLPGDAPARVGNEATAFWTGSELCAWGGQLEGQKLQEGACLGVSAAP